MTSKAARELAMKLGLRRRKMFNGLRTGEWEPIPESVEMIQSTVKDLVEKAQGVTESGKFPSLTERTDLAVSVAPWVPEDGPG